MKTRQNNIELLRVFSMFLIVVAHYIYWGMKQLTNNGTCDILTSIGGGNYITMEPLYILSGIGVNCYVMITGYFLIDRFQFRWNGILRTWLETVFYLFLIGGIVYFIKPENVSSKLLVNGLFLRDGYWFVTCYFGLLMVGPLLALSVSKLTQSNYLLVLIVLFILCFQYSYGRIFAGDHSLGWFIFLFLTAGYIKKFPLPNWWYKNKGKVILGVWTFLFVMVTLLNTYRFLRNGDHFRLMSSANDGMKFFLSLAVFVYFAKTPMEGEMFKWIGKLGRYTFGVYLIHMNPFCFKEMWKAIIPETYCCPIIFHCFAVCMVIFVACIAIDFLRDKLFQLFKTDNLVTQIASKLPNLQIYK